MGPLTLFQVHPTYRISAFQGFFKPHNMPIYILHFLNILLNTSLIQVKSFVTYLLPTNYFLLLLKATKKPFNRAFCFKHSTFKLTFRELWSTTSCFKTVLREFLSCFSLIFRAFPAFCFSVIRCADHKKRPFFIQR